MNTFNLYKNKTLKIFSVQIKSPLLEKFIKSLMTIIKRPTVMLLLLAATVRHTG